jgi:Protein kinase domain/Nucleoside 2-deoxyribosyltransferase
MESAGSSPARMDALLDTFPRRVDRYTLRRVLHFGGNYTDYAAVHTALGSSLVIRHEQWLERCEDPATSAGAIADLTRARKLQTELRHPRILRVLDFFEFESQWLTVFEVLPEVSTLAQVEDEIQSGRRLRLSLSEYLRLCAGLTEGLAAVHRAGYVHRTLSKHTVYVDRGGTPTLADLGCAVAVELGQAIDAPTRRTMNPWTAAPEQLSSTGTFTPGTDIWALGITLYEMRYLQHPYAEPDSPAAVFGGALFGELSFPDTIISGTSAPARDDAEEEERLLRPWLARMLERDPTRRYRDALNVQRDLEAIVAELDRRPARARVFVALPFADEFDELWRAIRAACRACRLQPLRIDQAIANENIWEEIREQLQSSDMMIAVASPQFASVPNPNVMLEVGYMRALSRPVLVLTSEPDTLPFDLRTHRALVYRPDEVGGPEFQIGLRELLGALIDRLPATRGC